MPSGKFKGSSDKGKGKAKHEFKGGMLIEKPPKGKGERPDKRPLPKGRQPNPRLGKGEGIEPYEMFSEALDNFYLQNKEQACTWHCAFDVGSFNRTDLVHHPPRVAGSNLYSFTSVHERGPGLSSGPQESEQENRSDVEPIITILPPPGRTGVV